MNGTRNKTFLATTLCLLSIFVIFSSINADESLQESFYDTYLQVVIKKLQSDPSFKNKLQKLSMTQIKNGQTSLSLHDITHELQNELHDVKRKEIDRLRRLIRARTDSKTGHKVPSKQLEINDIATHMDHSDPQYFTDTDIQRLLYSAMQNIQDTDVYRHERYKEHEMRELLKREEFLSHLSKRDRLAEEKRQNQLDAQTMRALKHNHPGSKAHFLNIWRTFDDMHDKFNAKTFFKLHDSNSDDFWDPVEVEILMSKELEQHYDLDAHPNDKAVMNEEMLRMREHFIEEVDIDEIDSMISEKEFMVYTKTMGFDRPELSSYKYIDELRDQGHEFNDKDLDAYKYKIKRHEMDIASKLGKIDEIRGTVPVGFD